MPFGGEHPRIEGSDGALCLLPQWHHLRWCSPTTRIPEGPAWGNHSWECSASLPWLPHWRGCCRRNSPCWGPQEEQSTPHTPCKEQTMRVEASPIQFPGLRGVLHPSSPITTTGQAPPVSHESRQRPQSQSSGGRKAWPQRAEWQQAEEPRKESKSSPKPMEAIQKVALPLGFKEVMACLRRDPSPATALEVPPKPLWLEPPIKPAVAMMCTSHIVQDKAMGITYMDTVTMSMGWVALRGPHLAIQTPGPTIEDITDLP